jgi:2-polyprenyl-3-methyl-5-hydroxy-6-metoxy-1,4-benzoquinol methylase
MRETAARIERGKGNGPVRAPRPSLPMSELTAQDEGIFRHDLPSGTYHPNRDEALIDLTRGERVIHVGCTDWPLTNQKLDDGTLLHKALLQAAADVYGVDVDEVGIKTLRARLGGSYTAGDLCTDATRAELVLYRPTVVLASDVIEHIANPGSFIEGLGSILREVGSGCRLILSTPNGLALRSSIYAAFRVEVVHPDHRAVYTPSTLTRLLLDYDLEIEAWHFYAINSGSGMSRAAIDRVCRAVGRLRPVCCDGMIVVARPSS